MLLHCWPGKVIQLCVILFLTAFVYPQYGLLVYSITNTRPFVPLSGRDFICIQSMDGILMFFEQESFSFSRFLPGFLLPGPLSYNPRTDAFITVSSLRQVENYKYQTLAVATDVDCRAESEQQKLGSGKRLTADWTLMIGEQAMDICILSSAQAASFVFVLGERNFFCIKANGQMRFMKKLEYNPSCFLPYASVIEGTINSLVGNHNNMLLLPHVPVALRVANFQDLKGVIVTLSSTGDLQCSYLGTDPALFQAPRVEARDINYEELDVEMKELQQIIREMAKTQGISETHSCPVVCSQHPKHTYLSSSYFLIHSS
uniref:PTHB1 N-terminal domain-containing protein n=1 Tax=Erpetoichthys calabaricus TaxID=27687 RepID=A0A8C4TFD3_ERPCA